MDWNRMKTIFIGVFFALNLFLIYELISLRENSQLETRQVETLEQRLKEASITYVDLPESETLEGKIACEPEVLDETVFQKFSNAQVVLNTETEARVHLIQPFQLDEELSEAKLRAFLQSEVPFSEQYVFFDYDATQRMLTFSQTFEGHRFFRNSRGQVVAFLNDQYEVTGYRFAKLGAVERLGEKTDLIPAIKAIEKLFDKDKIVEGSKVTKIELGYFTLFQTSYQALEPTWRFVVDDETIYFVTAIEGNIHELDDTIDQEIDEFKIEGKETKLIDEI